MHGTARRRWMAAFFGVCAVAAMPLVLADQTGRAGVTPAGGASGKPDENRFTPVVVIPPGELDEPMAFDIAPNGRIYVIERKGALKMYDPASKTTRLVATIPVNTKYTSAAGVQREAEEGLVGMTLDPNFEKNHWIYMLYADPEVAKHVLARWELLDELAEETKTVILEYPVQRETCCHTGGGMTWDAKGNLYITVGNNTSNSLGSQTDERPGRAPWDDQRGAANTNDLRGKILRIHPEPDGSYTIPEGNLFPPGTAKTRPEIYTMGHRNAWRVSLDSKTGYMYWGEVGPDANEDTELGPRGYDELNQAKKPGFFGWPYFIADNQAYPYYDYVKDQPLAPKDPNKPTNTSVNNTGLEALPPAVPAFVYYPYAMSEKFPELGSGARSATGGPIFRRADFAKDAPRVFPAYYEGKWLAADLSRGWIMAIEMDEQGNYKSMERFVPSYRPSEMIDLRFGPEGDLYVLDYGSTWFAKSADSQLVRIEYNGGNRAPIVQITADRTGGVAPFKVAFSSAGTQDYDGDTLAYEWMVESAEGDAPRVFKQPNPTIPFDKKGIYVATLTVTDPSGAKNSASLDIVAGNAPPAVSIAVKGLNKTFFMPGAPLEYQVQVADQEDGTLAAGKVAPEQVAFSIDYVPEGFDVSAVRQGQEKVDATSRFAVAKALMAGSDCATCHNRDTKSRGPSFKELAEKYEPTPQTLTTLATKIRNGGSGVWGPEVMPAHPLITMHEAATMSNYMVSYQESGLSAMPLQGTYTPTIPQGDNGRGALVLRAVYSDKGVGELPALNGEAITVLRAPKLGPAFADVKQGVTDAPARGSAGAVIPRANSHIAYKGLDLTGIKRLEIVAQASARNDNAGGAIEVRLGSPTGPVIGQADVRDPAARAAASGEHGTTAPGKPAGPIQVPLKPTTGVHDVYFVFKNPQAREAQPLMTLSTITIMPE